MSDPTETIRREMLQEINNEPNERADLESKHGQVWTTSELPKDFEALSFLAPFAVVRRKSDGKMGSLFFQHDPRYYYSFSPE